MRIRKHAKISPPPAADVSSLDPVPAATKTDLPCQLNQSPWDLITFSLPPPHDDDDGTLPHPPSSLLDEEYFLWWCVATRTDAVNSSGAGESRMKKKRDDDHGWQIRVKKKKETRDQEVVLCTKMDTKGWQCGEIVKDGNPFCDFHLPRRNKGGAAITKTDNPARRRKSASNNLEFYYYSGFGPKWGKKRGTTSPSDESFEDFVSSANESDDETPPLRLRSRNATNVKQHGKVCSGSSDSDENDGLGCEIEDEFDDDEDGTEQKRFRNRKPIKARSLKSLM